MKKKEPKNLSGTKETNEAQKIKKQLITQAAKEIRDIQLTGQMLREQIEQAKMRELEAIEEDNKQKHFEYVSEAAKRAELIKKMGEAAKTGNFQEMQRIKSLLHDNGLSSADY